MIEYFKNILIDSKNITRVSEIFNPCYVVIYDKKYIYHEDLCNIGVMISSLNEEVLLCVPANLFLEETAILMKESTNSGNKISTVTTFVENLFRCNVKDTSRFKSYVKIFWLDLNSNHIGSSATLLNAGDPTNILYQVCGTELSDTQIDEINAIDSHLSRMSAIYNAGCRLQYADIEHETFKNNLLFLDSNMPQFIADCLLVDSMPDSVSDIKDAVERVANQNPLAFTGRNVTAFYEHKMKVLLDAALGMTPAKEWNGRYDASGGYIVVRKDGEIVCYHFYNRNDVEDYLYCNTRFERASRSRYKYGNIFRGEDGNVYIRLNLQIRFKK